MLLVEDSRTQAAATAILLESQGFQPEIVEDLASALTSLESKAPDVILLDMVLPDATGLDGLARLRATDGRTAIVILTSVEDESLALEALQKGAQDYVTKGSQDATLLARTLRHAIERQRILAQLDALTEELRGRNEELARVSAEKDRFLGMAAHDLRNPLGIIISFGEFILREGAEPLTGEQREFVSIMRKSARFMLELVNDLLDVSAIQSGHVRLRRKQADLVALCRSVVELNGVLAEPKGIRLRLVSADDVLPAFVDPVRLEQVLGNLLSNGVKFSRRDTEITVSLRRDGGEVLLAVADQGQGMPPKDLEAIFDPLVKKSVRSTAGEKDTGLGLSIVRDIVRLHGGTITAQSEPGVGTTFAIRLPLDPPTEPSDDVGGAAGGGGQRG